MSVVVAEFEAQLVHLTTTSTLLHRSLRQILRFGRSIPMRPKYRRAIPVQVRGGDENGGINIRVPAIEWNSKSVRPGDDVTHC
jgi:hypothetical protein